MGTSVNQPSPNTRQWNAVAAAYRDERFPIERVLTEIWRAARQEPDADIREILSSDGIVVCLQVAASAGSPSQAAHEAVIEVAAQGAGSVAADIGRRAAILSAAQREDRQAAFARQVFVQATDYLVSRDLPGYIGSNCRNKTVSEAANFKDALLRQTKAIVSDYPPTAAISRSEQWREYVQRVVEQLAR